MVALNKMIVVFVTIFVLIIKGLNNNIKGNFNKILFEIKLKNRLSSIIKFRKVK